MQTMMIYLLFQLASQDFSQFVTHIKAFKKSDTAAQYGLIVEITNQVRERLASCKIGKQLVELLVDVYHSTH